MVVHSVRRVIFVLLPALALAVPLAPPALADTCCANTRVEIDPRTAVPGAKVELTGLRCLAADNTGPLAFAPRAFWLWQGSRAAEADPDTAPGEGLPQDIPPTETWLPFDSAREAGGVGSAVITVPKVPDGRYQLWWWCEDGNGPGAGIHYSTGPKLTVGDPPDTATAGPGSATDPRTPGPAPLLLLVAGLTAFVGTVRVSMLRRRRGGGTGADDA
ncbi:MAG TPA: hypothetical protein VGK16_03160 [Candidatus Limnocylindrales bacterium]|jgi:hypothetical protein